MKAILLCAGRGSRLLPLTQDVPKCLVPVDGMAILDHQIRNFRSAGITEFVIVGGYRINAIADHVRDYDPAISITLIHNPFWSVTSSIASLWMAKDHLTAPFVIANGDVIISKTILRQARSEAQQGINLLVEKASAHIDDMRVALHHDPMTRRDYVAGVSKDLPPHQATHRSLGVILCPDDRGRYRQMLEKIIAEDGGPQQFHHHILHRLADRDDIHPLLAKGDWMEIDTPQDIILWQERNKIMA